MRSAYERNLPALREQLSVQARDLRVERQVVRQATQIPPDGELALLRLLRGERLELLGELCIRIVSAELDASTGGQVTCPHLRPGEECRITVTGDVTDSAGVTTPFTATTDPDRDYTFPAATDPGLLPGLYRLTIAAPGYEDGHVNVTVPMGQVVEATPVALEQSPSIVGTIQARVRVDHT